MKSLLINSPFPVKEGVTHIPLQLAYPAAVLEKNHFKVKIIDLAVEKFLNNHLLIIMKKFNPNLIVVNSETTVLQTRDFCLALKLAKLLKKTFKNIPIAMMGGTCYF